MHKDHHHRVVYFCLKTILYYNMSLFIVSAGEKTHFFIRTARFDFIVNHHRRHKKQQFRGTISCKRFIMRDFLACTCKYYIISVFTETWFEAPSSYAFK